MERKNIFIKPHVGKTVKIIDTRTGRTNKKRDFKRDALPPGKRISKNNKVYYEKRKNRSDIIDLKI